MSAPSIPGSRPPGFFSRVFRLGMAVVAPGYGIRKLFEELNISLTGRIPGKPIYTYRGTFFEGGQAAFDAIIKPRIDAFIAKTLAGTLTADNKLAFKALFDDVNFSRRAGTALEQMNEFDNVIAYLRAAAVLTICKMEGGREFIRNMGEGDNNYQFRAASGVSYFEGGYNGKELWEIRVGGVIRSALEGLNSFPADPVERIGKQAFPKPPISPLNPDSMAQQINTRLAKSRLREACNSFTMQTSTHDSPTARDSFDMKLQKLTVLSGLIEMLLSSRRMNAAVGINPQEVTSISDFAKEIETLLTYNLQSPSNEDNQINDALGAVTGKAYQLLDLLSK